MNSRNELYQVLITDKGNVRSKLRPKNEKEVKFEMWLNLSDSKRIYLETNYLNWDDNFEANALYYYSLYNYMDSLKKITINLRVFNHQSDPN